MSHFNEILHYTVDVFKKLRDEEHSLTGQVYLRRSVHNGSQKLHVTCKINIMTWDDFAALGNQLRHYIVTGDELVVIIDVDRCRRFEKGIGEFVI